AEPTKLGVVNIKKAAKEIQALSEKYSLDVDPYAKIEDISVGMQQRIDGNGQSELIEAITGLRKVKSGKVIMNGQDVTNKKTRKITETGLGHIPSDRHKHGLVLDFTIGHNM
ncbi:hypothetical protein RhiirA1_405886, partial [Rhizophagus irregularis]